MTICSYKDGLARVLVTTWLYSVVIGSIPLSADNTYAYLGSRRLRICFIDFTATSGGSTFAVLLLCAVVGPSLLAVSICYSQIFIAARVQAKRIYDVELAAVAAGRRAFSPFIYHQTKISLVLIYAARQITQPKTRSVTKTKTHHLQD